MSADTPASVHPSYPVRIPSLFEIFFGKLANWFRRLAQWRKQGLLKKGLEAARRRRAMRLETLEPRVLLSADAFGAVDLGDVDDGNAFDDIAILDTTDVPSIPADAAHTAGDAAGIELNLDGGGDEPQAPINVVGEITLTLDSSSEAIVGVQTVYLSFEGAQDVDYEGPVVIADLEIDAFGAPSGLDGEEADIIAGILAALEQGFGAELVFTTEAPLTGEYSTIYIGGDSEAFGGLLYGVAEKVDLGNQDRSDIALVFSDNISAAGRNASEYGKLLAGYIAHELGHLLGYEHAHEDGDEANPLAEVAFDPKVHAEIGKDARTDAIDGFVEINGQSYAVHPKIVAALTNHMPYYNAGTVAGDAFPDVVMGQFAIHPIDHATWLTRVLDMAWAAQNEPWYTEAEKSQILAWSYGFLTHSAGDHWAHTLVNQFAEGVAPGFFLAGESLGTDQRDLGNMLRHFMTEAYIADAMPGVDTNPDRTEVAPGDFSDNSTPEIPFEAPVRFIYDALIRPFPNDPTTIAEMQWKEGTLQVQNGNQFVRTEGKWGPPSTPLPGADGDSFKVGNKITVTGFSNPVNNGTFIVTAVTDTHLTVETATNLVDETASGDEAIKAFVPVSAKTSITVNDATNSFIRTTGSFKADGFAEGVRFTIYGSHNYHGDYLVKSVSDDGLTLTVHEDLNSGFEVGNGDEQLVAQGSRGVIVDGIFKLQDKLEMMAIERGPRHDLGLVLLEFAGSFIPGELVSQPTMDKLFSAYLYNWVDDITEGIENWGEVGLAFAKAMWDPQSRRDLQQEVGDDVTDETGELDNADPESDRSKAEDAVGPLDVFFKELDDPDNDINTNDSYVNHYLLPMFGLPDIAGDLRHHLGILSAAIEDLLDPLALALHPITELLDNAKEFAKDFAKEQIEEHLGVSFETFEFLTKLNNKMDLASITVNGTVVPVFKSGDHELLDGYLGITPADHHDDFPERLTEDLDAALAAAGLGTFLRADAVGNKLQLVAIDPTVTSFQVTALAGNSLGFGLSQDASMVNGKLVLTAEAAVAGNGRITSAGVFSVSINGATPADEVTIAASDTSTNHAVGNDVVLGPVTFSFHDDAEGGLNDAGQFSKADFIAYKNSVTLTKLLYLMEDDPLTTGASVADNQLSELYGDILTALALADDPMAGPVGYDFGLLNMNGAHGGNILTTTLPGVGGHPWMSSIDADQVWREDSATALNSLFRVSHNNDSGSAAVWTKDALPVGEYTVYATWLGNVTQEFDDQDPAHGGFPDKKMSPAQFAQYTIFDGTSLARRPEGTRSPRISANLRAISSTKASVGRGSAPSTLRAAPCRCRSATSAARATTSSLVRYSSCRRPELPSASRTPATLNRSRPWRGTATATARRSGLTSSTRMAVATIRCGKARCCARYSASCSPTGSMTRIRVTWRIASRPSGTGHRKIPTRHRGSPRRRCRRMPRRSSRSLPRPISSIPSASART